MSKDTDPDGIFDSMPPAENTLAGGVTAGAEVAPAAPTSNGEKPPFDPYKFQHLTVSPMLRQELSAAKLPRLEPEFFQDTLPPNHLMASSRASAAAAGSANDDLEPLAVPLRKRTWIVVALLFGVGAGVWFGLVSAGTDPAPPAKKESNSHPGVTDVSAHAVATEPVAAQPVANVPVVASAVEPMPAPEAVATLPARHVERGGGAPERSQANPKVASEPLPAPTVTTPDPTPANSGRSLWTEPR